MNGSTINVERKVQKLRMPSVGSFFPSHYKELARLI